MKGPFFSLLAIVLSTEAGFAQGIPINPMILGQNYWYVDYHHPSTVTPVVYSTNTTQAVTDRQSVAASGCRLQRIGGKAFNIGDERPQDGHDVYYISMIDDIRRNGCEPVLTLPFLLAVKNATTPEPNEGDPIGDYDTAVARSIRTLKSILRTVNTVHKRNVKYVIIGNEPDKDYKWTDDPWSSISPTTSPQQIAANIAGYVKPMAEAVKQFDPSIKVIAPEYTHYNYKVYDHLFNSVGTNSESLTGLLPNSSLAYVDFMSYHYYLHEFQTQSGNQYFDEGPYTGSNLITPTFSPNSWEPYHVYTEIEKYKRSFWEPYDSPKRFRGAMREMRQRAYEISQNRLVPMGWMLTETNSSHNNESASTPTFDTRSMHGAQNIARIYALAMEYGASAVMMWSVKEGSGANDPDNRGYLNENNGKRASYFHYKAMADHFQGTYYPDQQINAALGFSWTNSCIQTVISEFFQEPNPPWLHFRSSSSGTCGTSELSFTTALANTFETKAFASKGENIAVMVLNHSSQAKSFAIRFDGNAPVATNVDKKFSFSISSSMQMEHVFTNTNVSVATGSGQIEGESTVILLFDCNGALMQRLQYRKSYEYGIPGTGFSTVTTHSAPIVITPTVIPPPNSSNCLSVDQCTISVAGTSTTGFTWQKLPAEQIAETSHKLSIAPNHTVAPGLYSVVAPGCGTVPLVIPVHQNSPLVNAGPDVVDFCSATSVTLGDAKLPSNQTYSWSAYGGNNLNFVLQSSSVPQSANLTLSATAGGCTLTDVVHVKANAPDIMIEDDGLDNGTEPNPNTSSWFIGTGIWVRNQNDAGTSHQNPVSGITNYVKVKVINKGCVSAPANAVQVSLYHTKASTTPTWQTSFSNFLCSSLQNSCTPPPTSTCGDLVNTLGNNNALAANGGSEILTFQWNNPVNQMCFSKSTTDGWWNLLAHVSHTSDALPALTPSISVNAINSNNVAVKQVFVTAASTLISVDYPDNCIYFPWRRVAGFNGWYIRIPDDHNDESLLDYADVYLCLSKAFVRQWYLGGAQGYGVDYVNDSVVHVTAQLSTMANISFLNDEYFRAQLYIIPRMNCNTSGGPHFAVHLLHEDANTPTGGARFLVDKNAIVFNPEMESLSSSEFLEFRISSPGEKEETGAISLFPTPANQEVTISIQGERNLSQLKIMDLQGRLMYEQTLANPSSTTKLLLSHLSKGTYLIYVKDTDHRVRCKKIVLAE